jgi:hypothetical protein
MLGLPPQGMGGGCHLVESGDRASLVTGVNMPLSERIYQQFKGMQPGGLEKQSLLVTATRVLRSR